MEERDSQFPKHFSGAVTVELLSGDKVSRRVPVNLGSGERALTLADIVAKFHGTAGVVLAPDRVNQVLDTVLSAGAATPVRKIAAVLRA